MNNNKNVSFFENKYVRKAFEDTARKDYDSNEVINSFWKKYSYINAIRNVYDAAILMEGENNHPVITKQLKIFMRDLISLLVANYYAREEHIRRQIEKNNTNLDFNLT